MITILHKICQCNNCYAKLEQHWIECIYVCSSPITHFFDHKKFRALHLSVLSQKFPNFDLFTFGRLKIRTLTPNRFKNQTNDTLTLLGHDYNHQRGFLKQKIVTVHRCGFNLKFPKHFY